MNDSKDFRYHSFLAKALRRNLLIRTRYCRTSFTKVLSRFGSHRRTWMQRGRKSRSRERWCPPNGISGTGEPEASTNLLPHRPTFFMAMTARAARNTRSRTSSFESTLRGKRMFTSLARSLFMKTVVVICVTKNETNLEKMD